MFGRYWDWKVQLAQISPPNLHTETQSNRTIHKIPPIYHNHSTTPLIKAPNTSVSALLRVKNDPAASAPLASTPLLDAWAVWTKFCPQVLWTVWTASTQADYNEGYVV